MNPRSLLYHVSEDASIARFAPRPSRPASQRDVVWAVHPDRLHNYLLPRECPRICAWATDGSRPDDIARLLPNGRPMVAIEAGWMERVAAATIHLYHLRGDTFVLQDANAGYFVSTASVTPVRRDCIDNLPAALAGRGATLVSVEALVPLAEDVERSSLGFSMIRMRNAAIARL